MGDGEKLLTHLNSALKVLLGLDIFPLVPKKRLNFVDQCNWFHGFSGLTWTHLTITVAQMISGWVNVVLPARGLTIMVSQALEIIRRLESGDSQGCGYVFIEPSMINYLCYLETDKLRSFMTWRETELPFQVTDIETTKISTVGQDVVYLVNCSAFQTSTRNWACDWKSIFVMKWNWRTHSLRAGCKILKNQQLKEISNWNTNLLSCAA